MSYSASDIETQQETVAYAKMLRERIVELQKKQELDRKAFPTRVATWQSEMKEWIQENAIGLVESLDPERLKSGAKGYHTGHNGFRPERFFQGAPMPPAWPEEKRIDKIRGLIRHLAISQQKTVRVTTSTITELFTDKEGSSEE